MPLLTGFLVDVFGVAKVMLILPLFTFVSSLLAYLLKNKSSKEANDLIHSVTSILFANSAQSVTLCLFVTACFWFSRQLRLNSLPLVLCTVYSLIPLICRIYAVTDSTSGDFQGTSDESLLLPDLVLNSVSYGCIVTLAVLTWIANLFSNRVRELKGGDDEIIEE